jgi:hypothetical protein
MSEGRFWHSLQLRVCRELAGIETSGRHGLACEQFVPLRFDLEPDRLQIRGHVWIRVGPREQEKWEFWIISSRPAASRETIDWPSLLPPDESTQWMRVDAIGRRLAIEPGIAVPIPH